MKRFVAAIVAVFAIFISSPASAVDTYAIKVVNASDINMVAKESRLPILIRNDYDSRAHVLVHIVADNARVTLPEATEAVVPGFSTYTVKVPVSAISSGDVTLSVWLTSMNGIRLTPNKTITMHINSSLELTMLISLGALVVLLAAAGVWRTLRKRGSAA